MIKVETIGMLDAAKVNPVITSESDVTNYQFITHEDNVYLVANTLNGDDSCREDVTFKAGEYLNRYLIKAWEGQKLIADEKHIKYATSKSYKDIVSGTTLLKVNTDGKFEVVTSAPTTGVYFKVTDKCTLTEKAIKVLVIVADAVSAS